MARARVQHADFGSRKRVWEIDTELDHLPLTVIDATDQAGLSAARSRLQSIQVPLTLSPGFLLYLIHHPDGDWLMLNLSHVVGDGMSALRLMTSIIRAYADDADPAPDLDQLAVRDLRALAGAKSVRERIERTRLMLDHLGRSTSVPTRVASHGPQVDGTDVRPGYGFVTMAFTAEETHRFMSRRVKPATVNDMLLAVIVLAIRDWNEQHGEPIDGRTSVLMPVNMRPGDWWYEILGNFSSWVSVPVDAGQQTSFAQAVAAVQAQTDELKRAGASGILVDLVDLPSFLPNVIKARLADVFPFFARTLAESSVLSNLGRLPDAPSMGDAGTVTGVYFSPPAPMPIGIAFGAATVGEEMFLTLRYRTAKLDDRGARELADIVRHHLLGDGSTPASRA
jgi:NRPS condensation-like uncharacterized protein